MRDGKQLWPGMLTILVKTILNTNNNTSTINYCQYQYQCFCDTTSHCLLPPATFIFPRSSFDEVNIRLWSRNGKITIVYNDMMLMSKNCSSIYQHRYNTTVLVFILSVTVMLLLTELTSAPDDKSIGIEYCQIIRGKYLYFDAAYEKFCRYLRQYWKVSQILLVAAVVKV